MVEERIYTAGLDQNCINPEGYKGLSGCYQECIGCVKRADDNDHCCEGRACYFKGLKHKVLARKSTLQTLKTSKAEFEDAY